MKKTFLFLSILLLVLASCTSPTPKSEISVSPVMEKTEEAMIQDEALMDEKESMMPEETMMKTDEVKMTEELMQKDEMMAEETIEEKTGNYTSYSADLIGTNSHTVLFFHANWCPSCRAADAGITSGTTPAGLMILKTDFDSETALKKKYGVTSQHTFVLVDGQGELVKKWVGGTTIDSIVEKL